MAGRPELAAAPPIQNVVVYVSNDNFAQAFSVAGQHQNVSQNSPFPITNGPTSMYQNSVTTHPLVAPMVAGFQKTYVDKHPIKSDYTHPNQLLNDNQIPPQSGGYYHSDIPPASNNFNFQENADAKSYSGNAREPLTRESGPGRPETDLERVPRIDGHLISNYMGNEPVLQNNSPRCDSVRSETTESSCSSSGSSGDENIVIVRNHAVEQDMVLYDSTGNIGGVRPVTGGVVLAVNGQTNTTAQQQTGAIGHGTINMPVSYIIVPYGWKRILNNGNIMYVSPSNTVLNSLEQAKEYLLSSGTCKCGLECHFKYDNIFNFDPKVVSKPWAISPDRNPGDMTKLCNHKRKIIAMASLESSRTLPSDIQLRKDCNRKRKKRKLGLPYSANVPMQQPMHFQSEKSQHFNKELMSKQQLWQQHNGQMNTFQPSRPPGCLENVTRYPQAINNRVNNPPTMTVGENGSLKNLHHPSQIQLQKQVHHMPNNQLNQIHMNQHRHLQGADGPLGVPKQNHPIPHENHLITEPVGSPMLYQQGLPHPLNNPQKVYAGEQPLEPTGPGRPVIYPDGENSQRAIQQSQLQPTQYQMQRQGPPNSPMMQNVRAFMAPNGQVINNFKPNVINHEMVMMTQQQQKMQWQQKMIPTPNQNQQHMTVMPSIYERVPPLHQANGPNPMMWNSEDLGKKKTKVRKGAKNRTPYGIIDNQSNQVPCPNIDVRHIQNQSTNRAMMGPVPINNNQNIPSPSFMEDPSGYLAQQTALLNSTINRQTGVSSVNNYNCKSPSISTSSPLTITSVPIQNNEISLPNNSIMPIQQPHSVSISVSQNVSNNAKNAIQSDQLHTHGQLMAMHPQPNQIANQQGIPDSSEAHHSVHCQECISDSNVSYIGREQSSTPNHRIYGHHSDSQPSTPSSSVTSEDPVTSSTFFDKQSLQDSPDSRPIQGGTVSTSNVSPADGLNSGPPTPNSNTPCATPNSSHTPNSSMQNYPQTAMNHNSNIATSMVNLQNQYNAINHLNGTTMGHHFVPTSFGQQPVKQQSHQIHQNLQNNQVHPMQNMNQSIMVQKVSGSEPNTQILVYSPQQNNNLQQAQQLNQLKEFNIQQTNNPEMICSQPQIISSVVTTMASGRTFGSNTITSVLAGRSNTATVSINNSPQNINISSPSLTSTPNCIQASASGISKSPLEMVQSVVSSIQVPHSHHQMSPTLSVKHSTALPPGHVFVSSGNQLLVASTGNPASQSNVMPPPPPKLVSNQAMPPISVSPIVTNVTAAVTQMIPAVAPQVLGQQTVLVNTLPGPFVIQPGVTMTMDGVTVGQNMQIPQIVTGNVIQPQIQLEQSDPRRNNGLISPENKKKGKRKKNPSQQVTGMLQLASPQGTSHSGLVVSQQSFPQQIQMAAHSPQGLSGPVMQALTIVPNKAGGPAQIVMNGQANLGAQQIITNSQPAHQFNLLQPVNLINGATGVVQNFPTIQQFIVPNLGGMVMNPDGTATILQDTSNIGMQLQIQNVNGQNVLTPVQNSGVFNGSQGILTASPAGMVIRTPPGSQGKIIQQQHSPGAQFLSPGAAGQIVVNGAQFSGQLSPLVASVSPSQQVTFNSAQQIRSSNNTIQPQADYIQCNQIGQTLMVPYSAAENISSSSSNTQQGTTYVQQNTTIVQQQTTMVSNNHQVQNYSNSSGPNLHQQRGLDQNVFISSNNNRHQHQLQAVLIRENANCRQSVSTQTAANQNTQSTTTSTFCQTSTISAGSPPDTTTLSPVALGGQSPHIADTTTHSGSTDDGLSPTPSNSSVHFSEQLNLHGHQSMAMVHCISSSEPDSQESLKQHQDYGYMRSRMASINKHEYEVSSGHMQYVKRNAPIHIACAESSLSGMQCLMEDTKSQNLVSLRNFEKNSHDHKTGDTVFSLDNRLDTNDGEVTS